MLRRAAAIHFTPEAERAEANRLSIDLEGRSTVVPPPWRGETTTSDPSEKADRPTVLFMSRLPPKKNVQGLLCPWAQVVADRPDAQRWVTDGGDAGFLHDLHDVGAKSKLRGVAVPSQ